MTHRQNLDLMRARHARERKVLVACFDLELEGVEVTGRTLYEKLGGSVSRVTCTKYRQWFAKIGVYSPASDKRAEGRVNAIAVEEACEKLASEGVAPTLGEIVRITGLPRTVCIRHLSRLHATSSLFSDGAFDRARDAPSDPSERWAIRKRMADIRRKKEDRERERLNEAVVDPRGD